MLFRSAGLEVTADVFAGAGTHSLKIICPGPFCGDIFGNAEFQRIARRDKKAFFSNQCKEIQKKKIIGKIRDLFKKIRDTKGIFYAKIKSIKGSNGMDLTEAEDIKKRWQEYTEELYKMV